MQKCLTLVESSVSRSKMATYTDVVDLMNEVHKEKGGTYAEGTAVEIVQLAAEFYNRNEEEINSITRRELKRQIDRVYEP